MVRMIQEQFILANFICSNFISQYNNKLYVAEKHNANGDMNDLNKQSSRQFAVFSSPSGCFLFGWLLHILLFYFFYFLF